MWKAGGRAAKAPFRDGPRGAETAEDGGGRTLVHAASARFVGRLAGTPDASLPAGQQTLDVVEME